MANLFLQNNTSGSNDRTKAIKIIIGVLVLLVIIPLAFYFLSPTNEQDEYTKRATEAARKVTPNAEVSGVKVAGNFATALVNDPTAKGQGEAGNTTLFKINNDNSMTQLAAGSSFDPIQLIELGVPLVDQAKLTDSTLSQVRADLAILCGYSGGSTPGYKGFYGSFDGLQIDQLTLDGLGQTLTNVVIEKNSTAKFDEKIICVTADQQGSSTENDTFTIQVQFITSNGKVTKHSISYTTEPGYGRSYMFDGQTI